MMSGNPFTNAISLFFAWDSFILQAMRGCSPQSRFRIRCRSEIKSVTWGCSFEELGFSYFFVSCVALFVRGGFWGFEGNLLEVS